MSSLKEPTPAPTTVTLRPPRRTPEPKIDFRIKLGVGAVAGVLGTSICFPIDTVKTRLQSQDVLKPRYFGPVDCFKKILHQEGPRGFYKGLPANLVGVIPEKAIKLAVNDLIREHFASTSEDGELKLHHQMLAGAGAGLTQVIATNPMEIMKIRLQLANLMPEPKPTTAQVFKELFPLGFYKGVSATIMRDVPFSIIIFPTFAMLNRALADENGHTHPLKTLFAGAVAGATAAGAVTPADVIKTNIQKKNSPYTGIYDCFKKVYSAGGMKELYRGAVPRMSTQAPLFGIALLAFEVQKAIVARNMNSGK